MKSPFQNLIQKFKAAVFEKDELEFREMSNLKSTLATSGKSGFQLHCKT